jgi:hypothetical protein
MSAGHTTLETSIASAEKTKSGAIDSAVAANGQAIANAVAAYPLPGFPTGNAAYAAAIAAANVAKANALYAAEQAKQSAVAVARDTFRTTGETNISL